MSELIESQTKFDDAVKGSQLSVVHFSADWVEQCKQVDDVIDALSKQPEYSRVKFFKCLAEELAEVSLRYKIDAAPTVILFSSGKVVDRVDGADPVKISNKIKQHSQTLANTAVANDLENESAANIEERLKQLINRNRVMLFMKGNREVPRCGFSRQIIEILNNSGVEYGTFDILTDEKVRQGLKTYSDWPTYPQLYVNGELIGGLDIVKEMQAAEELIPTLKG